MKWTSSLGILFSNFGNFRFFEKRHRKNIHNIMSEEPQRPKTGYRDAFFRGRDQGAQTPPWLWALIHQSFLDPEAPVFDPCPPDAVLNGLRVPWGTQCIVNPPFRDAAVWLEKALQEWNDRKTRSVMILPLRSSAKYFHSLVLDQATDVVLLGRRITFEGYIHPFPIPIVLVGYGCSLRRTLWKKAGWSWAETRLAGAVLPRGQDHAAPLAATLERLYGRTMAGTHCASWEQETPLVPAAEQALHCIIGTPKPHLEVLAEMDEKVLERMAWIYMVVPFLTANYYKPLWRRIRSMVFLAPSLQFGTTGAVSSSPSILVTFGRARLLHGVGRRLHVLW